MQGLKFHMSSVTVGVKLQGICMMFEEEANKEQLFIQEAELLT